MKAACTLFLFLLSAVVGYSQTRALTDKGEEVILYENKTWRFANKEEEVEVFNVPTNQTKFTKSDKSTFLIKSEKANVGVYLNPKKWSFKKADTNEAAEYTFELRDKDAYAMIITERIAMPIETLKKIALQNARGAAPDIAVVKEEMRNVNGTEVFCMQMNGTLDGIKFTYFGYYYSSKSSTVQFLTYTSENLLDEYMPDIQELLNGFTTLN